MWNKNEFYTACAYVFVVSLFFILTYYSVFWGFDESIYATPVDYQEQRLIGSLGISWWSGLYFSSFIFIKPRAVIYILIFCIFYLGIKYIVFSSNSEFDNIGFYEAFLLTVQCLIFVSPIYIHKLVVCVLKIVRNKVAS